MPTLTHDRLTARADELRRELAVGQQKRAELQAQLADLDATLLRITGAIQVLQELLAPDPPSD